MELLEHLEPGLLFLAAWLRLVLETLSVFCVFIGLVSVLRLAAPFRLFRRRSRPTNLVRLTFGSWLSMALEFQLGADIVSTTAEPTGKNLIQLAAIALIRTFLNVFLAREIEAEQKLEVDMQKAQAYE